MSKTVVHSSFLKYHHLSQALALRAIFKEILLRSCLFTYLIEGVSESAPHPCVGRLVLCDGWKCLLSLPISTWHLAVI